MKEKELSSQSSNVWNEISERKYMNRKLEHELDAYEIDDLMDKFDIKNGCTNYSRHFLPHCLSRDTNTLNEMQYVDEMFLVFCYLR